MTPYLLVGLGGALGAMARHGAGSALSGVSRDFPLSTLVINVVGSLLMGLLAGLLQRAAPGALEGWRLLIGVGVLGGFTTFSAFSLETAALIERGHLASAALYTSLSVALSVAALFVGLYAMRAGG